MVLPSVSSKTLSSSGWGGGELTFTGATCSSTTGVTSAMGVEGELQFVAVDPSPMVCTAVYASLRMQPMSSAAPPVFCDVEPGGGMSSRLNLRAGETTVLHPGGPIASVRDGVL